MKKTNVFRKICTALLATVMAFGLVGCGNKAKGGGKLSDVEIWGAPATEKVLRDKNGIYDDFKTDAAIDLTVARGEYEGAQIILSARKDLTFDVLIGNLKSSDGTEFPSGKVEVFGEKYVEVRTNYDNNGAPTGWYPDALVPFDGLKKQGENTVKAGENQGLYFRFEIPLDQKAGEYTGNASIIVGGESKDIPVRLNVTSVTVSEVSHTKNIFLTTWSHHLGELDSTQAMHDKYIEKLFEYRLSPNDIIMDSDNSDEDIEYYVEKAYAFMQNPKCTNISIPYVITVKENPEKPGADKGTNIADPVLLDKYITALANKSFETGFNMLAKSTTYFATFLDEPTADRLIDVEFAIKEFNAVLKSTADRIASEKTENKTDMTDDEFASFKAKVVQSIRNVRNVLTTDYNEDLQAAGATFCPQMTAYDTESGREDYAEQEEKWWYTCISPRAPYPSFHTEDTLLSARSIGWMQAQYGVTGNLFWATDIYGYAHNVNNIQPIEELYEGSAVRFPNVNGDGYLFYPGKKYGVDGPIGSLRLEALRDGLEEFEILYALSERYAEISALCGEEFTSESAIESLTRGLYNGTVVDTDSYAFSTARSALMQLSILSESDADFCITDFADDGYGNVTYKLYANNSAVVKNHGEELTQKEAAGDGFVYTLKVPLEKAENSVAFTVAVSGAEYAFGASLGGKVSVNSAADASESDFAAEGVEPQFESADASSVAAGYTGVWAEITLPACEAETLQSFRMSGALLGGADKSANKMLLHIYYDGDDEPELMISAKHTKDVVYIGMANTKLKKGMNVVELSFAGKNWTRLGNMEFLAFNIGGAEGEPERALYIADSVIYAE